MIFKRRLSKLLQIERFCFNLFLVLSDLTRNIFTVRSNSCHRASCKWRRHRWKLPLVKEEVGLQLEKQKMPSPLINSHQVKNRYSVFCCYNAFNKNIPIFIDEPELSLHVDWQEILLPTLLQQATGNQFFVATHSPFIYTLYPDKEFMLGDTRGFQGEV